MSSITINGGKKVNGVIKIHGSKNSVLPILVSCLITNSVTTLTNCPNLSDVRVTLDILKKLGCKVTVQKDIIIIDSKNANNFKINKKDSCKMRASIIFLGALLSRFKKADMYTPGGCNLGERPIDLHIDSLKKLGANIDVSDNHLNGYVDDNFDGQYINLKIPSVGATENIIIASCLANGTVTIKNPAREPEIIDLCNFLNSCGANIKGAGSTLITIVGVKSLNDTTYKIMPDRIVTVSYMALCAVCGGKLLLKNTNYKDIKEMLPYFKKSGCMVKVRDNSIYIKSNGKLKSLGTIKTVPYPGFATDAQPIFVAMAVRANGGMSRFIETIFDNRFCYTNEIVKLGARIKVKNNVAYVFGNCMLNNKNTVKATDLRGAMSLVILASSIKGTTKIYDSYHIHRGYGDILDNLRSIGINIKESIDEKGRRKQS